MGREEKPKGKEKGLGLSSEDGCSHSSSRRKENTNSSPFAITSGSGKHFSTVSTMLWAERASD